MSRTLKVHLPLALLSGAIIFIVLNLAAWYNLRGELNVCRRQGSTRITLWIIAEQISDFRVRNQELPKRLADIPDLPDPIDKWGNQIQYIVSGEEFALLSFGRDGKSGGVGLDADIFHDDRNRDQTLPTLRQFFLAGDSEEVDISGFILAGLIAGAIIAFAIFRSLQDLEEKQKQLSRVQLTVSVLVVIVLACAIGIFLLPLHIPSGH